jgi:hypothetical protein
MGAIANLRNYKLTISAQANHMNEMPYDLLEQI